MGFCRKRLYYILDGAKCNFVTKFKILPNGKKKKKKNGVGSFISIGDILHKQTTIGNNK